MRLSEHSGWFGFLIVTIVIVLSLSVLGNVSGHTPDDHAAQVRDSIKRAAKQCYALEGAYPPDLAYLEAYGIEVDETELFVDYRPVAANLPPEIFVVPLSGSSQADPVPDKMFDIDENSGLFEEDLEEIP